MKRDFEWRFISCKIIYFSTKSLRMVLENHRAYNLSHAPHQKITQMLLLDDLKTYHKSDQKAADVPSKLKVI